MSKVFNEYENDSSAEIFQHSATSSSVNLIDESVIIFQTQNKNINAFKESSANDINKVEEKSIRPRILQNYRKESPIRLISTSSTTSAIETQTDWSWLYDIKMLEKLKQEIGLIEEPEEFEEVAKMTEEINESKIISPSRTPLLESIGPPKILQYQAETKKPELIPPLPENRLDSSADDIHAFFREFNINLKGGHPCEFCSKNTLPWPTIQQQENEPPNTLYCCNDYREFVEAIVEMETEKEAPNIIITQNRKDNKKQSKKARRLAKQRQEQRNLERQIAKQKRLDEIEKRSVQEGGSASTKSGDPNSRQLRCINYQLSNLRFMQEGWTVRPESPDEFDLMSSDEDDEDVIVPATILNASLKLFERPLTFKYYKNGDICMILFPDGSGSVFYPSGRLAISVSLVSRGLHILTAFSDDETNPIQLAIFDPYGNVCCNYISGKIRVQMNASGGMEFGSDGSRKKFKWLWWDPVNHVHAPPYQPLIFALNEQIYVRIHAQQKIHVNFYADAVTCRFRVGSNLVIAKPDSMASCFKPDQTDIYLRKKKTRIEELLELIRNTLYNPPIVRPSSQLKLPKITEKTEQKIKHNPIESRSTSSIQLFALTQSKDGLLNNKKQIQNQQSNL